MSKYNLNKILPHKPPMILIDDIKEVNLDEKTLTAIFRVYPEKLFYEAGKGINSLCGNRREYCRHALGYTEFVSVYAGIESRVKVFITRDGEKVYFTEIRKFSLSRKPEKNIFRPLSISILLIKICMMR